MRRRGNKGPVSGKEGNLNKNKKEKGNPGILRKKEITLSREEEGTREDRKTIG